MKITKYKSTIGAAAVYLILTFTVFGQVQTEIQKLFLNLTVARQINGGETHSFQFNVKAGFYARGSRAEKH